MFKLFNKCYFLGQAHLGTCRTALRFIISVVLLLLWQQQLINQETI